MPLPQSMYWLLELLLDTVFSSHREGFMDYSDDSEEWKAVLLP